MGTPEIIYEDADVIVVNKPPWLPVHGGSSVQGTTLVDFLIRTFPEIKSVGDDRVVRPGIVHRLDRDTSGVMVVARNQESFTALKKLFSTRAVEKKYLAILCGAFKEKEGVIAYPIGRLVHNPLRRGVEQGRSRIRGAREAVTEFRVLKESTQYSLVEMRPKTGRMHQIRVHAKAFGHPVACDTVYGGRNVCCPAGVHRQLLHAQSISFSYPEGRKLSFEVDPPEDFLFAQRLFL